MALAASSCRSYLLRVLLLTACVFVAVAAWRFGAFSKNRTWSVLERLAEERGYVMAEDRSGLTAVVDGVTIDVRVGMSPTASGPLATCSLRAMACEPITGRLNLRPKHEDEPALVRTGDLDFDTCFRIDASARALACELLDEDARAALFAFGPRGECSYVDGAATFRWELRDFVAGEDIDRAIAIVHCLCRARHGAQPYR